MRGASNESGSREPRGLVAQLGRRSKALTVAVLAVWLVSTCTGAPDAGHPATAASSGPKTPAVEVAPGDAAAPSGGGRASTHTLADAGEWLQQGKNYAQTRYSDLTQITADNVQGLKTAWTFSTGVLQGHEGAPLVVGSTMYVVTPYPDIAYALDLTQSGLVKWTYRPDTDPWSIGIACCDVVNRGWAYADGKLIYNLLDDRTIALDANTGKVVWQTKLGDVHIGEAMTMAPLVVKDKVIVGNSGGEMGVQGWIAALDLKTGKPIWRAYNTGPDSMVRIGAGFKAFYAKDRGKDLGLSSWPPDAWRHGGGTAWGMISYDPDLNLIYYGTSNPGPWTQNQRPGDNKWTATIFARDPDNGEARWANQLTPHDEHDYDAVNENILVDLPIDGRPRRLLVHFDRNAFGYTIDRETGEVLAAKPFVSENWATGIDLATGAPVLNADKSTTEGVNVTDICPSDNGGKNEEPAAYSPRTRLFYVPTINMCMDYEAYEASYIAGTPYWGAKTRHFAGPGGNYGELIAWDATTGTKVWGIKEKFFTYSGVLVTAGNVAFYGTADGWFKAVDARSGHLLWKVKLGSGIVGSPISYIGPDGKQYVAILAGVGGNAMLIKNVPGFAPGGGMLYVFSL